MGGRAELVIPANRFVICFKSSHSKQSAAAGGCWGKYSHMRMYTVSDDETLYVYVTVCHVYWVVRVSLECQSSD